MHIPSGAPGGSTPTSRPRPASEYNPRMGAPDGAYGRGDAQQQQKPLNMQMNAQSSPALAGRNLAYFCSVFLSGSGFYL